MTFSFTSYGANILPPGLSTALRWAASSGGVVGRVDPATGRVQKVRVGGSPVVAYANGAVWVADSNGTPARIGPRTGSMRSIRAGNVPTALAAGPDVRATVLPSPASHGRGTLTLASQLTPNNLSGDPAVAWDTYD